MLNPPPSLHEKNWGMTRGMRGGGWWDVSQIFKNINIGDDAIHYADFLK